MQKLYHANCLILDYKHNIIEDFKPCLTAFTLFRKMYLSQQKREGILQSRQIQEEITGNVGYVCLLITLFANKRINIYNMITYTLTPIDSNS